MSIKPAISTSIGSPPDQGAIHALDDRGPLGIDEVQDTGRVRSQSAEAHPPGKRIEESHLDGRGLHAVGPFGTLLTHVELSLDDLAEEGAGEASLGADRLGLIVMAGDEPPEHAVLHQGDAQGGPDPHVSEILQMHRGDAPQHALAHVQGAVRDRASLR